MRQIYGEKEWKIVSIEVTAPGYAKFHLAMRFKKPGVLKFPVEMEMVVEGIEG